MSERPGTQSASPVEAPSAPARPRLIYDGDCGFCFYWARYWQRLTGDSVEYRPYQQVLSQYPSIPEAEFKRAVQFIAPDGRRRAVGGPLAVGKGNAIRFTVEPTLSMSRAVVVSK